MDSLLIFLVFIAISAVSAWLQKRRQAEEEAEPWPDGPTTRPGPPRRPGAPPPAVPPGQPRPVASPLSNWQQELRRLLEGDLPAPRAPTPPPVPAATRPDPAPTQRPPPAFESAMAKVAETTSRSVAKISDTAQAFRRAQQARSEAAASLREVQAKTERRLRSWTRHAPASPAGDIGAARALLASPRSARQAVIASVILAPPRGLE